MFIITARNEQLGQEAVKQLNAEGLQPKFHRLDLNDTNSIEKLKTFLQTTYGGLDILVNNAGMAFKVHTTWFNHSPKPVCNCTKVQIHQYVIPDRMD